MNKDQFLKLHTCFGNVGYRIATMNGLIGDPPMTEDVRLLALKLNSVVAQFADQSRIGRLELYSKKADWVIPDFMEWKGQFGWKNFFSAIGLFVHETNIPEEAKEQGADFALCVIDPRRSARELGPAELARLDAMMKGVKESKAAIEKLSETE